MEVKKPIMDQIQTLKGAEFICELPVWANRKGAELVAYKTTVILLHKDKEPHYLDTEKRIFVKVESAEILEHLAKIKKRKDEAAAKAKEKKKPAKKKKLPDVLRCKRTVSISARYSFTVKESSIIARDLGRRTIDKAGVEDEKKSIMSDFKDRLDRISMDVNKLSRNIVDGYEYRDFNCYIVKHFKEKVKRFHNKLNDEVVDEAPLDPSDYQLDLED